MNKLVKYLDDGGDPNAYIGLHTLLYHHTDNLDCFRLLLERGANPNQEFMDGIVPPIIYLCMFNHEDHLEILMNYASVNTEGVKASLRRFDEEGFVERIMKFRPEIDDEWRTVLKTKYPRIYRKYFWNKWLRVKCSVKLLALHQRAVVTANHPLRMLERGEFKLIV